MKSKISKVALLGGLAVAALMLAEPAMAGAGGAPMAFNPNGKTIGDVANNLTTSLRGVNILITIACYLGALVFGVIGAMKWKAYGEQPDRTPFKIPVTFWGIAVMLAGFPEFMGTGIVSLWGAGAQVVAQP